MMVNSMNCIVYDGLGLHSRIVREMHLLTLETHIKYVQLKGQKLLLRLREEDSRLFTIFWSKKLSTFYTEENHCGSHWNSRYLTELPVSGVGKNVHVSPSQRRQLKLGSSAL
jgi:hypothetical protein